MPSRRLVLRAGVALGCGLCLPVTLSGCDAKSGAGSSSSAPAVVTMEAAPATSRKATQAGVQYQLKPKGGQKCGNCRHFIAESKTCHLVDGEISPEAWCMVWAPLT